MPPIGRQSVGTLAFHLTSGASLASPLRVGSPSTHPHITSPFDANSEPSAPRFLASPNGTSSVKIELFLHISKFLLAPSPFLFTFTHLHFDAAGFTTPAASPANPTTPAKTSDHCFRLVGILFVYRFHLIAHDKMPAQSQMPRGTGTVSRPQGVVLLYNE